VNDSPSPTSLAWPTRWAKDSFTGAWTWIVAILLFLLFAVTFATGVFLELRGSQVSFADLTPGDIYRGVGGQALVELVLAAIVLRFLPSLSKFSLRELGFRVPDLRTIVGSIVGAIAMVVVANGLASLIDLLAHSKHQQDVVQVFQNLHDPGALAFFAFFAIVLAPFVEETFFRVFFFNLGLRYWGFWGGAVFSGLLFGMAHGDLYAAVPLTLGGMVLCFVYYRTRNAWASMISHSLFNTLSIVALLYAPSWVTN
jgi:hypothetical protein